MADQPSGRGSSGRRLDALGPREVVYCHQCSSEWYNDEHGLTCPDCEGEITEIVTPESDPRPMVHTQLPEPNDGNRPDPFHDINHRNPWENDSDPEEQDIEEHITHGPGGSVIISRTIRSSGPQSHQNQHSPEHGDPNETVRNFQQMLGTLMGPEFRPGPHGTSGPDTLFGQAPFGTGATSEQQGPRAFGGRFTYISGNLHPRGGAQPQAVPVDDLASLLGSIFGPPAPADGQQNRGGIPLGIQGLLATLLNPANARSGDAVYTQEALDQIISNLMDQHPSSNAPGPASSSAIASLPKKILDDKMLGPEGTGECSVCMDDVFLGTEVVLLPCSHWFHEACATAWLNEHNTCPICRKGIEGETSSADDTRARASHDPSSPSSPSPFPSRFQRLSSTRPGAAGPPRTGLAVSRTERENSTSGIHQARLDAIRRVAGRTADSTVRGPVGVQLFGTLGGSGSVTHSIPESNATSGGANRARRPRTLSVGNIVRNEQGEVNNTNNIRSAEAGQRASASVNGGEEGNLSPIQGITSWIRDRWSSNSGNRRPD